jgi:hypothetical protein
MKEGRIVRHVETQCPEKDLRAMSMVVHTYNPS